MPSQKLVLILLVLFSIQSSAQDKLKINGALRFNYFLKSWDDNNRDRGGDLDYDMIRLEINYKYKRTTVSYQQRFYRSDFGGLLLHHAWVGYDLDSASKLILGISFP